MRPEKHDDETGAESETKSTPQPKTSRRRILATSAVLGAGAVGSTSAASASGEGGDGYDDENGDEKNDHDADHDEMDDDETDDDVDHDFSLQQIVDDPAGYYVDIHTAANPEGAVRGQLYGEPGQTEFSVDLNPEEVIDGGTDGASGTAEISLYPDDETICFSITTDDVAPPYESPANTATHIHEAPEGDDGPPVVVFPDPQPRDPDAEYERTSAGCLPGVLAFQTGAD